MLWFVVMSYINCLFMRSEGTNKDITTTTSTTTSNNERVYLF